MEHTTRNIANPKTLEHYFLIFRYVNGVKEYLELKDNLGFGWNETKQLAWKLTHKELITYGKEILTNYGQWPETRELGYVEVKEHNLTELLVPVNIVKEGI